MRRQTLVHAALTLAVAGLISRALGGIYRVFLPRFVGAEALGLFQMAYPIYNVFLIISTSGLPIAVAKIVAEQQALGSRYGALRTFRVALLILAACGLLCALTLYLGADWLAEAVLGDRGAALVIRAVAPSVFFLSLISGWRGLFQGLSDMVPGAVAQVGEQIVRVVATLWLALWLRKWGVEAAAAGASGGAVVGSAVGLTVLVAYFFRAREELNPERRAGCRPSDVAWRRPESREPFWSIVRRLYALALPIVLGALILPLTQMIDTVIVPRQLSLLGYSTDMVRALYGRLEGMAMTLAYFPPSLLVGLGVALVPAVAEARARHASAVVREKTEESLWLTTAIALPASVGLFILAEPICALLFNDAAAGPPLAALAVSSLLISLQMTTTGLLQGLGRAADPVRHLTAGAVLKIGLSYYLTSLPRLGILGAAYASVAGFLVATCGNLIAVTRWTGYRPNWWRLAIAPGLSSGIMAAATRSVFRASQAVAMALLGETSIGLSTISAIAAGVLTYGLALWALGGMPPALFALVPSRSGRS